MDVTSAKSILSASENFKNEIDIMVCNAGVNNGYGTIFDIDTKYELLKAKLLNKKIKY